MPRETLYSMRLDVSAGLMVWASGASVIVGSRDMRLPRTLCQAWFVTAK